MRSGNRVDDSQAGAPLLEHRPLLDVGLHEEVGVPLWEARLVDALGIHREPLHGLRERDPLPVGQAPGDLGAHVADERPGAEAPGREARLFGGDGDDLDRAARPAVRSAQAINGLDRGEHAVDAVERAGVERGVEVEPTSRHGPPGRPSRRPKTFPAASAAW